MKKHIWALFSVITLIPGLSAAQTQGYVRKSLEPDFFIPAEDKLNRPEKLPPIFKDGKKITGAQKIIGETEIPEYQKKYEQYREDLENVAKTGEIAPNQGLDDALRQMDSGEVFEVKETPSQNSEVKDRFEKALERSLKEN